VDTLTHALSGALLARATMPAKTSENVLPVSRRVFVGFIAAAAPDLDVVLSYLSPLAYLYHHRGVTHSLLMLPLWSFALALLCAFIWRRGPGWRAYFGIIALSIGIHIAGDWITGFGTMLLAPFSDWRAALSTTFIIDLWFTGIILAGLIVSACWRRTRIPAVAGLVVLVGYVGLQFALQQRAIEFGTAHARSAGINATAVTALPRPVSPFNWMVVVRENGRYHYSLVNLWRVEPRRPAADAGFIMRLDAHYLPLRQAAWVVTDRFGSNPQEVAVARDAFVQPGFAFFRWFAQHPVLYRIETGNPETCVWFQDLRFFTPGRPNWPFRYGMCRKGSGLWHPYHLANGARLPVY
jgi:inner membrane protein